MWITNLGQERLFYTKNCSIKTDGYFKIIPANASLKTALKDFD
jgi:hypothetical protein